MHPKGLTITEIASRLNMNRNSVSKYLEVLLISGHVESHAYGPARVFFLTHRIPISALISLSSNMMVTLDENNEIIYTNDSFNNFFSIKPEEVIGTHIVEICRIGIGSDVLPDIVSNVLARQDEDYEVQLQKDDGLFYFKVKSLKMVFDDGSQGLTILMDDVTREKKDHLELEAKEARYRGIVEDQTEFITRFRSDGTLTFINKSYSQYLGKTLESLRDVKYIPGIGDDDRSILLQRLLALTRESPVTIFECPVHLLTDDVRWNHWSIRALFNGDDLPGEYQAAGWDITEKKEASKKIARYIIQMEFLSRKLQEFIELPPEADIYHAIGSGLSEVLPESVIAVSTYDSRINALTIKAVFSGKDLECISQRIGRNLIGEKIPMGDQEPPEGFLTGKVYPTSKKLYDIFFQQYPADTCTGIEEALNLGKFYSVGLAWQGTLLGNITFALRRGEELKEISLIDMYMRAVSIILQRYAAQQALMASEELYRSVLENVQDVFYRSDNDGNLIMASPSWAEVLGYPSLEECVGHNIAEKFYFEPVKRKGFLKAVYAKGSVFDYEVVLKKKDGMPLYVSTNSHVYHDKNGNTIGVEGIFRDITERRAAAEKIQHYITQIEFLSQRLIDFIELIPSENIFEKIAADLQSMIPGSLIVTNSYNPGTGMLTTEGASMPDQVKGVLAGILEKDLIGCRYKVDDAGYTVFRAGVLSQVSLPLYEVVFRMIPESICRRLESDLRFGDIYTIGFVRGGNVLGNASIFLLPGSAIPDRQLIEMYAREASIALQRHIAENEQRRSDEIFFNLARNSPFPIVLHDSDGKYRFINENFTRMFGYDLTDFHTVDEWLQLSFPDPEYRRNVTALWREDLEKQETGEPRIRTFFVECKNKTKKEIVFRAVTLADNMQCVIFEDITERRNAEQTRRLLSSIIESTNDAVIGKDIEGTIISWNRAAENLYGYNADEILGHNILRIIPPDKQEEMQEISKRIIKGESISNLETQRVRKDGTLIDVLVTISPITDENGIVTGASTIARGMQPRTSGEDQPRPAQPSDNNRRSSAPDTDKAGLPVFRGGQGVSGAGFSPQIMNMTHLFNALKTTESGIAVLDLSARYIWVNEALVSLIGTGSSESIVGKSVAPFIASEQRKQVLDHFSNIRKTRDTAVFPVSLLTSSGRIPVEASVSLVADDNGTALGYLAILQNTGNERNSGYNGGFMDYSLKNNRKPGMRNRPSDIP